MNGCQCNQIVRARRRECLLGECTGQGLTERGGVLMVRAVAHGCAARRWIMEPIATNRLVSHVAPRA